MPGHGRIFPAECCFQVIYFISNISFVPPAGGPWRLRVETIWLTGAVKNVGVRSVCRFCVNFGRSVWGKGKQRCR
jgi:hypothetical protein